MFIQRFCPDYMQQHVLLEKIFLAIWHKTDITSIKYVYVLYSYTYFLLKSLSHILRGCWLGRPNRK